MAWAARGGIYLKKSFINWIIFIYGANTILTGANSQSTIVKGLMPGGLVIGQIKLNESFICENILFKPLTIKAWSFANA